MEKVIRWRNRGTRSGHVADGNKALLQDAWNCDCGNPAEYMYIEYADTLIFIALETAEAFKYDNNRKNTAYALA